MPLQFAIPRRLVDKFLRKMSPLVGETVELFNQNADDDGLTPKLKEWIERFQVAGWAEAYEDFNNFLLAHYAALPALGDSLLAIPQPDQIETQEDAQRWLDSVWEACEKVLDDDNDDWIDAITEGPPEPIGNFPTDDKGNQITRQAMFLTVSVIISHNYFSCMVHRKSLFQLVAEAKAGNDESLLKAVQIDKRCLADIPYFRERILQAVIAGEDNFVRRVMRYRKKPPFQSATSLQPLYLIFSLLDAIGLLEAYAEDSERFADLCQDLVEYGPEDDAADVESFAKTLRRFKAKYRTLGPPRERWLIVKDTD
jgi:hypothetical protein